MRHPFTVSFTFALLVGWTGSVAAQEQPPDKQRGVRGRLIVAQDLWLPDVWPITGTREKALRSAAIVRRPSGRPARPLVEAAPPLTVVLDGGGLRQESPETPTLKVQGMRFVPGSIIVPRAVVAKVQNNERVAITVVGGDGGPVKIAPGEAGDVALKAGVPTADGSIAPTILHIEEWPFAQAVARVLPSGRVLPVKGDEIPLVDIPGGEYTLTFFLGADPLRQQPLVVPERGVVFIDATVSGKGVVDVSIKDSAGTPAPQPSVE